MVRSRPRCFALAAVLLLSAPSLASAQSKDALYQEMVELAAQIRQLKPLAPGNQDAATALSEATSRYQELSGAFGGDDPGFVGTNGGGPIASRAQGAFPVPPGCAETITNLTDNTVTPIPDGPGGSVAPTIVAAGLGSYLYVVQLTTNITHTFNGDLDITLTSPAGTTITITTDNGGPNNDVFDGTVWQDRLGSPATDFVFTDGVTATPLQPESAFAAFVGEDPNGTWTLTVGDDAAVDVGSINQWSLSFFTFPTAPITATTSFSNNTPTPIPDGPGGLATPTVMVAGADVFLFDVDLTTNITHTFSGDLDITLSSPAGDIVTITTDNGGPNNDVFNGTLWNDDATSPATDFVYADGVTATPLFVEGALGANLGENPNGTWTLNVIDDAAVDTGTIQSWSLDITTATCALPDADLSLVKTSNPAGEVQLGDPVVYTLTAANSGPSGANGVVVTDTLPAGLTYVSNDCGAAFAAPTLTWNIGILGNGASAICNVTVTASAIGVQINNATVSGDENDPVPGDNSDLVTINVSQTVLAIPTVDTVGMVVLVGLLAFAAMIGLRRRRQT